MDIAHAEFKLTQFILSTSPNINIVEVQNALNAFKSAVRINHD